MKHLYFVRHGLSEANKRGVWSGSINTPLSPEGHEQAKLAGQLARQQGLVFDIVLSSPLDRAHHTAQHISRETGYPIHDIMLHNDLRERHFGVLEGTNSTEIFEQYLKDEAAIDIHKDVERLVDLQWRAQQMLNYIQSLPHDTVLVVAHGAFGRALKRAIVKGPLHERLEPLPNAQIIKFI